MARTTSYAAEMVERAAIAGALKRMDPNAKAIEILSILTMLHSLPTSYRVRRSEHPDQSQCSTDDDGKSSVRYGDHQPLVKSCRELREARQRGRGGCGEQVLRLAWREA